MIKVNEKVAIDIPDSRNIDVLVLTDVKKKGGKVEKEWKVFGHVGRNIKSAIKMLLEANVMHSEARDLWDMAVKQDQFIKSIDVKAICDANMQYTIDTLNERIAELEKKLRDK